MTRDPHPIGVLIPTTVGPEEIAGIARQAEELGFGSVWIAEECYAHGGFAAAAIALGATSRIPVGLGVIPSVLRHPAVTAMEVATLGRAFPGRLLPGIGHGVPFLVAQMGLSPASVLAALEECVLALRALLAGHTVHSAGREFTFDSIRLSHPVDLPVLTGVIGPRSLRLSGRIADGTVLSLLAGPRYIEAALREIRAGMVDGGGQDHLLPTIALSHVDRDRRAALAQARPALGFYLSALGKDNPLVDAAGHHDELAELITEGNVTEAFPGQWLDEFSVTGDPDDAERAIRSLLAAGATSVVLMPTGRNLPGQLRLLAESVLPRFGR